MPKMVFTHKVEDVAKWMSFEKEREEIFAPFAKNLKSHIDIEGSNMVAMTMDMHGEKEFFASHNADYHDSNMKRQGVIRPVTIFSAGE
ncbi:hypothetical protein [Lentilitoribacter sp. EG35]|uniref:hypothetical protein n=1 Tax=Lentilitoribacter sp. EG35 TaxID=3234192 RepID=UPI0034612046